MSLKDREVNKGKVEIVDNDESAELVESLGSEEGSGAEPEGETEKEGVDLQQKYLRLAADFENYKKRLAREKADVVTYSNEELI